MRRPDIPVLTTLRFPAAMAIVFYHFLPYSQCPRWIYQGFSTGVSFFYILSGFILYYNYVDFTDRGFFWLARFARVWPVHLFTLVLVLLVMPFPLLQGYPPWQVTLPANILLLHAWLPFSGSVLSFNTVSWSLSVEAFFYFCFPWLLSWMKARGAAVVLVAAFMIGFVLVFTVSLCAPAQAPFVMVFNPAARLFEFVLGMAACRSWLADRSSLSWRIGWTNLEILILLIGVGLVIGVPALLIRLDIWNQGAVWVCMQTCSCGFAALIWIFACQMGVVSRLLSGRVCEWFGEVSFALYMCHQVILRWIDPKVMTGFWDAIAFFLLYLAASLLLSAAIFHFVETPARRAILSVYKRPRPAVLAS